jgi:hypothetical protein
VVVRVLGVAERRGAACLAQTLYEDWTPKDPLSPNRGLDEGRQKGPRPTKRDRRRIDALRGST